MRSTVCAILIYYEPPRYVLHNTLCAILIYSLSPRYVMHNTLYVNLIYSQSPWYVLHSSLCPILIYSLLWYIHEQTLDILSLMLWNHGLESWKYCFSLIFKYFMYFWVNWVIKFKLAESWPIHCWFQFRVRVDHARFRFLKLWR